MSSTPATRPEPIEEDEAERRALEAAVAEARGDPRSARAVTVAWRAAALTDLAKLARHIAAGNPLAAQRVAR